MLDANVYQVGALVTKFINKLEQRKHKSGMIVLGSVSSNYHLPTLTVYSATKVFVKYLCQSIAWENAKANRNNVDLLCSMPSMVRTKMIKDAERLKIDSEALVVTVTNFVGKAMRDLGYETTAYGALRHEMTGGLSKVLLRYNPKLFYYGFNVSQDFFD